MNLPILMRTQPPWARKVALALALALVLTIAAPLFPGAAPEAEASPTREAVGTADLQEANSLMLSNGLPDDGAVQAGLDVRQPARVAGSNATVSRATHVVGYWTNDEYHDGSIEPLREHIHPYIEARAFADSAMTFEFSEREWTNGDRFEATFEYPCTGIYDGRAVGARLSMSGEFNSDYWPKITYPIVQLPDLLYAGAYVFSVINNDMRIEFFYCDTKEAVHLENSYLTYSSQNYYGPNFDEHGNPYPLADWTHNPSETIMLPADRTSKVVYDKDGNMDFADVVRNGRDYLHAFPISNDFDDFLGGDRFTYNATTFYQDDFFEFMTPRTGWFCFSSAGMGSTAPPAPTKTADCDLAAVGQDVSWTIEQKANTLGVDTLSRYRSFVIEDALPTEVDYTTARLIQISNDVRSDITESAGTLSYDPSARCVTFTFDEAWLASTMPLLGESYRLEVDTTVNERAVSGQAVENKAVVTIGKHTAEARTEVEPFRPPAPVKTADRAQTAVGEPVTWHVAQQVNMLGSDVHHRYTSMEFSDALPAEVDFISARMMQVVGDEQRDVTGEAGKLAYDETTRTVSYRFDATWLKQSLPLNGELYRLVIDTQANERLGEKAFVLNKAAVSINGHRADAEARITGYKPAPARKTAEPVEGSTVMSGQTIAYTISYLNESEYPQRIVISDSIPDLTSYQTSSLTTGEGSVTPSRSSEEDGSLELSSLRDGHSPREPDGTLGQERRVSSVRMEWDALQPGETAKMSFTVVAAFDAPALAVIENSGFLTVNDAPALETNRVEHVVGYRIPGDLVTVYKSANPANGTPVAAGQTITYTLTAVNTGSSTSGLTRIRDYVPAGTSYREDSAALQTAFGANGAGDFLEWTMEGLAPNESRSVSFQVVVDENAADLGWRVVNSALYETIANAPLPESPIESDPTLNTNMTVHPTDSSDTVPSIVQILKTADPVPGTAVNAHNTIRYTLTVRNTGASASQAAHGIRVSDRVPEGTSYIEGSVSPAHGGSYDSETNTVNWTISELAVNEEAVLSFEASANDSSAEHFLITNQALYGTEWTPEKPKALESASNIVQHPVRASEAPASPGEAFAKTGSHLVRFWWLITGLAALGIAGGVFGLRHARTRKTRHRIGTRMR